MLEFIRKIFREEQKEDASVELKLNELILWVDESSKPLMEEMAQKKEGLLMRINDEIQLTRTNLEHLQFAKLQNENIPYKAKQYMEGNRESYIRGVNSFLGKVEINNKEMPYLAAFSKEFVSISDELGKATLRSYAILQEFFANEVNAITKNIRNIDKCFKEIDILLNGEEMKDINELKNSIKSLQAMKKNALNLTLDIKSKGAGIELASRDKETLLNSIEEFNKSEEHNHFITLNEEKKNRTAYFEKSKGSLYQSFGILERPLRKYSHMAFEHEELALKYLKEPVDAILNDSNLLISHLLENMKEFIVKNKISLDEKKKEKSLEEISRLSKPFLENYRKELVSMSNDLREIEIKINQSGVAEKFKAFNKELDGINKALDIQSREFESMKSDFSKLQEDISQQKSKVEGQIRKLFGKNVVISFS